MLLISELIQNKSGVWAVLKSGSEKDLMMPLMRESEKSINQVSQLYTTSDQMHLPKILL
jgi:hypothetical protein